MREQVDIFEEQYDRAVAAKGEICRQFMDIQDKDYSNFTLLRSQVEILTAQYGGLVSYIEDMSCLLDAFDDDPVELAEQRLRVQEEVFRRVSEIARQEEYYRKLLRRGREHRSVGMKDYGPEPAPPEVAPRSFTEKVHPLPPHARLSEPLERRSWWDMYPRHQRYSVPRILRGTVAFLLLWAVTIMFILGMLSGMN